MSNFSISCLPVETQAYILSKLDGRTSAVAKKVCTLWNEIITGFETCMHFWMRCCLREIPPYTLVELTRLMQLSGGRESTLVQQAADWKTAVESNLHWMYWKQVYAEYWRYRYIEHGVEKRIELHFYPTHGQVRCLYVQDNVIYVGHESGEVISWRNMEDNLEFRVLYKHHRRVTDITGLDMVMPTKDILNGEFVNKIVSSSMDTRLILYNLNTKKSNTIQHYSKQVNCVRSWGHHFVAAADRSILQGQPIWRSSHRSTTDTKKLCTVFSQSIADMTAVAFWEDTVVAGDLFGSLYTWSDCLGCDQQDKQDMTYITNLGSCIKSIFLLGKRIICYTSDGFLNVSKDKEDVFEAHNIYKCLYKTPECVAYKGSVLAIGCRFGAVYLYHLPLDKDWNCLNIAKPTRVIQTSQEHIHALAIDDDGDGPFIVIATESYSILIVQFRRHNVMLQTTTSHVRER
ncbi:uncharacterized protein LOC132716955 [Ruditapes philippinarum]|uniref:uncharacterized protein LOC132716955 n=1 Tax=Ruditapes philippinarum TaxID=129788 RepID=UPI00295A59DA|nr:uncharacterized protein LOC132716955 [Ruditapes philippinarum]